MLPGLVTVFGGAGFIGRYLVKRLLAGGARVRVAARNPAAGMRLMPMGDVGQVAMVQANIRDEASVAAAVANADAVVNLVGILYERGRQTFQAVHVEGAERIARTAKAAGATRLVHVSAIGADPDSPASYARTKAAGEAAVLAAFPEATIVRPSIVFGAEDNFFNRFAAMARLAPALPLVGGGEMRFQPVFVSDVAEAICRILSQPETAGRRYELGGPRVYTFRALMELMLAEIDRRRLLLPVPWPLANLIGAVAERLPAPMLTRDQVRMLRRDTVVAPDALGFADLGITPTAAEIILPTYLARFRRDGGRRPRPQQPV